MCMNNLTNPKAKHPRVESVIFESWGVNAITIIPSGDTSKPNVTEKPLRASILICTLLKAFTKGLN